MRKIITIGTRTWLLFRIHEDAYDLQVVKKDKRFFLCYKAPRLESYEEQLLPATFGGNQNPPKDVVLFADTTNITEDQAAQIVEQSIKIIDKKKTLIGYKDYSSKILQMPYVLALDSLKSLYLRYNLNPLSMGRHAILEII